MRTTNLAWRYLKQKVLIPRNLIKWKLGKYQIDLQGNCDWGRVIRYTTIREILIYNRDVYLKLDIFVSIDAPLVKIRADVIQKDLLKDIAGNIRRSPLRDSF